MRLDIVVLFNSVYFISYLMEPSKDIRQNPNSLPVCYVKAARFEHVSKSIEPPSKCATINSDSQSRSEGQRQRIRKKIHWIF